MYYVGVDIAKSSHVASIIDDGAAICFSFGNNLKGFPVLLKHLESYSKEELLIGLESTAHNLVLNNQTFKEYYDKKRSEGKNHYNALGQVANKVIRILYKIMTENIPFNLS